MQFPEARPMEMEEDLNDADVVRMPKVNPTAQIEASSSGPSLRKGKIICPMGNLFE
jgi:hypothetical protein